MALSLLNYYVIVIVVVIFIWWSPFIPSRISSKRTLRSNEITLPTSGHIDTNLDLSFSLQYPHYMKRDSNWLKVMLQRKRYKNRAFPSYKSFATGRVDMRNILQNKMEKELPLYPSSDEQTTAGGMYSLPPVAHVCLKSLVSLPVEGNELHQQQQRMWSQSTSSKMFGRPHERNRKKTMCSDHSPNGDLSEDEDYSSQDDLSDSEPNEVKSLSQKMLPHLNRPSAFSKPFKQKFVSLLNRLKTRNEEDSEHDNNDADIAAENSEIAELLDEIENYRSDSDPDNESLTTVHSTPKPQLRPYFDGSIDKEIVHTNDTNKQSDDTSDGLTEVEESAAILIPIRHRLSRSSFGGQSVMEQETVDAEADRILIEKLCSTLGDRQLPTTIILVNSNDDHSQLLKQALSSSEYLIVNTTRFVEIKFMFARIVVKIQQFCNSNAVSPAPIKIVVAGGDGYINSVLRSYVREFSLKSPDWLNYLKFYIIPLAGSTLGKFLSTLDSKYHSTFNDQLWRDTFDCNINAKINIDASEINRRVSLYLKSDDSLLQLPIAEAMLTISFNDKSANEESSQEFVPFIRDVHIGNTEHANQQPCSSDQYDDYATGSPPPTSTNFPINMSPSPGKDMTSSVGEVLDLQVDYWTMPSTKTDTEFMRLLHKKINEHNLPISDRLDKLLKKDSKASLKTSFRSVFIFRPPSCQDALSSNTTLSMTMVTKEKKKIMRISKKPKDVESKCQTIDAIYRLICTSKTQNMPLTVTIDGYEWKGVKFFQVLSQWQTHMKQFPVALFSSSSD